MAIYSKCHLGLICYEHEKALWLIYNTFQYKRNSFDLDKLDYLNRDLTHTHINKSKINYSRIINNACIIDGQIAYNKKIYNEINMVYERRFELFR